MDKIDTYRGKLIDEMTREELIAALNFIVSDAKNERKEHARQLDVLASRRIGLLARLSKWFGAIVNR